MADHEHLQWLEDGVDAWNERRNKRGFLPDLSGEDISRGLGGYDDGHFPRVSVDLSGINFSRANLIGSALRYTNLSNAGMINANLSDANFLGSNFDKCLFFRTKLSGADLDLAKFPNVKFVDTDISSANFGKADLKEAQFLGCEMEGAHLYEADIVGTDFIQSRPWTAYLFPPLDQETLKVVDVTREGVGSINDLLDGCRELQTGYGDDTTLYFRGESLNTWELRPAVMRASGRRKHPFRGVESDMLNDLMTRQPGSFSGIGSALGQWVFAQHHKLPTRLLDITRNPLVALFNACKDEQQFDGKVHVFAVPRDLIKPFNSDAVRIVSNFAKLSRGEQNMLLGKRRADARGDTFPVGTGRLNVQSYTRAKSRLYFNIRQESPHFEEKIDWRDLFRVFVVEPQRMFERLRAQSGAFLLSAFHERLERDEVLRNTKDVPIYAHHTLTVAHGAKGPILDDLRLLNVTGEVLSPSVDESAGAVIQQYLG